MVQIVDDLIQRFRSIDEIPAADEIEKCLGSFRSREVMVTVIGATKRGKSTLINAILGRSDDLVAPVDASPATSVISRFKYATPANCNVKYLDGHSSMIDFNEIADFVTVEGNPENTLQVDNLLIEGPFDGLKRISDKHGVNLVLVDTPGAQSIEENYDEILYKCIPQSDVILYVFTLDNPICQSDIDLMLDVQCNQANNKGMLLVLNKSDQLSQEEIKDAVAHTRRVLRQSGVSIDNDIIAISAKMVMAGEELPAFQNLISEVESLAALSNLQDQYLRNFVKRVLFISEPIATSMRVSQSVLSGDRSTIEKELSNLPDKLESSISTFSAEWEEALDEYEGSLDSVHYSIHAKLDARFSKEVCNFGYLRKNLQHELNVIVRTELQDCVSRLTKRLKEALHILDNHAVEVGTIIDSSCSPSSLQPSTTLLFAPARKATIGAALVGISPAIPGLLASVPSLLGGSSILGSISGFVGGLVLAPIGVAVSVIALPIGILLTGAGLINFRRAMRTKKNNDTVEILTVSEDAINALFENLARQSAELRRMQKSLVRDFREQENSRMMRLKRELDKQTSMTSLELVENTSEIASSMIELSRIAGMDT